MRFAFPWAFLILPLLALIVWRSLRRGRRAGLRFSTVAPARTTRPSLKARLRRLPLMMRALAVALLIVGLARPQQGKEEVRDIAEGIAIEMLVDRSGSMGQEFVYEGEEIDRLEAVKRIFKQFVLGDGKDLKGRPNDLIGMTAFARYADTVCPLTLSHGALDRFIETIRLASRKNEDGTAIGDGLALAAARLKTAEEQVESIRKRRSAQGSRKPPEKEASQPGAHPSGESYHIKSKIIILLTDGRNNAGKRPPLDAARLAAEWGVKVYAIGIGGGDSFTTIKTPFGSYKAPGGDPGVDAEMLRAIAKETGGAFWPAESAEKLLEIYKQIDKLERTEIESVRHIEYAERFAPFVLAALALLALERLLVATVLRRIP